MRFVNASYKPPEDVEVINKIDKEQLIQNGFNKKGAQHKKSRSEVDSPIDEHRVFKFSSFVSSTDIAPLDRRMFFEHADPRSFYVSSARKVSMRGDRWSDLRSKLATRLRNSGERFDDQVWYHAFYDGRQNVDASKYGEVWFGVPRAAEPASDDLDKSVSWNEF